MDMLTSFIHLFVDGHLAYFHLLPIMNNESCYEDCCTCFCVNTLFFLFGGNENILKLIVVIVSQLGEYTQKH